MTFDDLYRRDTRPQLSEQLLEEPRDSFEALQMGDIDGFDCRWATPRITQFIIGWDAGRGRLS